DAGECVEPFKIRHCAWRADLASLRSDITILILRVDLSYRGALQDPLELHLRHKCIISQPIRLQVRCA
ncbi:unnamed protein product, partial [Urochloa humidicola]